MKVSIILCTHRSERYEDFVEALDSLNAQSCENEKREIVDKESVRFVSKNCKNYSVARKGEHKDIYVIIIDYMDMDMDSERLRRYIDKIEHIEERIGDIRAWLCEIEDVRGIDKKTRLAVYKAVQEVVEASTDVVAMILKDEGKLPKDDYSLRW